MFTANRFRFRMLILLCPVLLFSTLAWADCGSMVFLPSPPPKPVIIMDEANELARITMQTGKNVIVKTGEALEEFSAGELDYDPLEIRVYEPGQRAIILWNGVEEILLLSTDQSATQKAFILEVIPLPSEPKVRLGSLETFEKAEKLIMKKKMWACAHGGARADLTKIPEPPVKITFHEKMGPHDVTIANVLNSDGFIEFTQNWIEENYHTPKAPIRQEFVNIIQSYLDQGYKWFVFDVITLEPEVQTREPLEYRFKSDSVFYPMNISTLELGETSVDLLVFTSRRSLRFRGMPENQFLVEPQVDVDFSEIQELDESWKDFFFSSKKAVMNRWIIKGDISRFHKDVIVK